MVNREQIKSAIDQPNFKAEKITLFQTAGDIIKELKRAELESRPTSKKLARVFNEEDKMKVAAKVWYFLRNQIFYEAEPKTSQNAKTINRFIYDATGDCKHFAVFSVGVLNACGVPCWFTFIGQQKNTKRPNHAYATALINGQNIVIDPCRKYFNSEAKYFYKWDIARINKKVNNN